ncbi:YkvA family protein [Kaistella sp.]|uniref:YkvA family protein n=1 Tax=Kaistella sp. TaxID=2782235 RepID=UPI00359FCAF7
MEQKFEMIRKTNKVGPIIIGILGVLYGVSPIDAIPDVIPVAGWIDDLVITGGSLLGVAQAFARDTSVYLAKIIGIFKWGLWILGGILIAILALLGVTIYGLFK